MRPDNQPVYAGSFERKLNRQGGRAQGESFFTKYWTFSAGKNCKCYYTKKVSLTKYVVFYHFRGLSASALAYNEIKPYVADFYATNR